MYLALCITKNKYLQIFEVFYRNTVVCGWWCLLSGTSLKLRVSGDLSTDSKNLMDESGAAERCWKLGRNLKLEL